MLLWITEYYKTAQLNSWLWRCWFIFHNITPRTVVPTAKQTTGLYHCARSRTLLYLYGGHSKWSDWKCLIIFDMVRFFVKKYLFSIFGRCFQLYCSCTLKFSDIRMSSTRRALWFLGNITNWYFVLFCFITFKIDKEGVREWLFIAVINNNRN